MDDIVQQDSVSEGTELQQSETSVEEVAAKEGEVSEGTTSKEGETPQSLTPELVREMIKESLATEREKIRQSVADKSRFEFEKALKRASVAESTLQNIIPELDEETKTKIELARLRGQAAQYQTKEQEDEARRQYEEFHQTFNAQMTEFITDSGIDPNDKRIDWGKDAKDAFEMQHRIHTSVAKILKENKKSEDEKRSQEIKDLETKLRKELGLDSVDTSNPVSATSEQTWLEQWGNGDIEATPQNLKKAVELQKKLYGG